MAPPKLQAPHRARVAAELAARFRDGETIPQLADDIGRVIPTVRRLLIEAGVRTNHGPMLGAPDDVIAATVVKRYLAGETVRGIAADISIPNTDVHRWLTEAGCEIRGSKSRMGDLAAKLAAQYEQGATIRQLAAATGWSFGAVRDALVAEGVTLRPRGIVAGSRHPKTSDPKQVKRRRVLAAKLRALYEKGATCEQIATRYRRSPAWACALLREAGTEMRPGRPRKKK